MPRPGGRSLERCPTGTSPVGLGKKEGYDFYMNAGRRCWLDATFVAI